MTRNYANTHTGIWRDDDFTGLTGSAQRTYWLLKSQPDISAAGILPLTAGRWATKAKDTTAASIRADLVELTGARFVFYDEDTEELLVRTFVRWDNGYGNPKRRPVILEAAAAVESLELRRVLAHEFQRLGLPIAGLLPTPTPPPVGPSGNHTDRRPDSHADSLSARLTETASRELLVEPKSPASWEAPKPDTAPANGASSQVNSLSGSLSDRHHDSQPPSERVVVTKALYLEPQPTTHNPQPPPPNPLTAASAPEPPAATTEGEGAVNPAEQTLIDEIRAMRPEWSPRSIARALGYPEVTSRPWPIAAAAMRLVAADRESHSPGRLRGDGPWWTAAASQQPKQPAQLNPPCGNCDPNRQVRLPDGRMARCPGCHPLRQAS
jgi:hypothetical protein